MDADIENQKLGIILRRMLMESDEVYSDVRSTEVFSDKELKPVSVNYYVIVDGSVSISEEEAEIVNKVFRASSDLEG